ncbi:MAG: hypothetical protein IT443_05510 [Phycisphaeraceae bacterium]|nr:hypothetical protein [Phycisphaeraceae bacterium]
MTESGKGTAMGEVDWAKILPFVRLFKAFGMSADLPKMLMALALVLVVYLGGVLLDSMLGHRVYAREFDSYLSRPTVEQFDQWRRAQAIATEGVFDAALRVKLDAFQRMVMATTRLDFGFSELIEPPRQRSTTVMGSLREMAVSLPAWLMHTQPWFLLIYSAAGLAIWALLGGALCRMAALEATIGVRAEPTEAVLFSWQRWGWFFVAPLIPLLVAGLIGSIMSIGGLVCFNLPGLDMLGGLLFGLSLFGGALVAFLLAVWAVGVHMLGPAVAVEGSDAFDVVSRVFSYVVTRPWQWFFYTIISLVCGAAAYLVAGALVFLTLRVTHYWVGLWVFAEAGKGVNRFEAMLDDPTFGVLAYTIRWDQLGVTGKIAAGLMAVWTYSLLGLLLAYAITFYVSAQTLIYLLLRRSVDGTAFGEVYVVTAPPGSGTAPPGSGTSAPGSETPAPGSGTPADGSETGDSVAGSGGAKDSATTAEADELGPL